MLVAVTVEPPAAAAEADPVELAAAAGVLPEAAELLPELAQAETVRATAARPTAPKIIRIQVLPFRCARSPVRDYVPVGRWVQSSAWRYRSAGVGWRQKELVADDPNGLLDRLVGLVKRRWSSSCSCLRDVAPAAVAVSAARDWFTAYSRRTNRSVGAGKVMAMSGGRTGARWRRRPAGRRRPRPDRRGSDLGRRRGRGRAGGWRARPRPGISRPGRRCPVCWWRWACWWRWERWWRSRPSARRAQARTAPAAARGGPQDPRTLPPGGPCLPVPCLLVPDTGGTGRWFSPAGSTLVSPRGPRR